MTDPNVETASVVTTEAAPTEDAKRKGRPRPETTIERDAKALELIKASGANGITRTQLAEELSVDGATVDGNTAYLSLFRLRKDGKIVRGRNGADHVWTVVAETPAA